MVEKAPPSTVGGATKGGGGGALIGVAVVLLLGAAGGILWFVTRKPPEEKVTTTVASTSTAKPETTLDLPPPDMPDTAVEDTAVVDTGAKVAVNMGMEACPSVCTGVISDAIKGAVGARAGTAKQCYKTALEQNEGLSGEMALVVRVGLNGATCSVAVQSDSTGSMRLQQCVKSKMVASYPAPKGGCVDVRVPINFKPKT
jgi:hypothetical protein